MCQTTSVPPEPREEGDFPMATYHTIRGQILARVPGLDPADIPGLLQMLVSTVRGPERWDMAQIRYALARFATFGSRKSPICGRSSPRSSQTGSPSRLNELCGRGRGHGVIAARIRAR